MKRFSLVMGVFAALLLVLAASLLFIGTVDVPAREVMAVLSGGRAERDAWNFIILESRLPLIVTSALAGSALAVSGLLLQTLFGNALADPSILGISTGASLGAGCMMLAFGTPLGVLLGVSGGFAATFIGAFIGALAVMGILLLFSSIVKSSTMLLIVGVLIGGILSDRWVQKHLKGRIFTGVIGLALTIPALLLVGMGSNMPMILGGAIIFGFGFGMFDVNNMPILCQFVSPRHRATGYGLMNLTGIAAGAVITEFLGKSADAGNMGRDFAILGVFVLVAIILQLTILKPQCINKTED